MTVDRDQVETTLLSLLRTPSYAGEEAEVARLVEARLRSFGATYDYDDGGAATGGNCGNLLAKLPGTVDAEPLFFNAHLDTVDRTDGLEPKVGDDGLVRSGGATILGGDDKAGVTAILEGVAAAVAAGLPRPPLELLFTVQEETGLHGARAFDLARLQAALGFVFDGGTPLGEMTISAPTQQNVTATFFGRAAHAGVEPERGVNAIACAATAIARLKQGRIDEETTANVGVITGGQATNIVSDRCELRCEARSRDVNKLAAQVRHMQETFTAAAEESGCRLEFAHKVIYRGFRIEPDEPVARLATAAVVAAGLEPSYADGGGGSDANVFCTGGKRCILMPAGQREPHTTRESVAVDDVATAARVVAEVIRLGAQGAP